MDRFELVADFEPAGDQPAAIAGLIDGLESGLAKQTLLGVTGSGKTFTMANVIQTLQRPTLILAPEQDAGRAALRRDARVFPAQPRRVFRVVLRLLPAGGLRAGVRHVYRQGRVGQRSHRADAAVGDQGADGAARRDHRGDGVRDLRPRRSRGVLQHGAAPVARRSHRPATDPAAARGVAVHAQRDRARERHVPRARRHHRHLSRPNPSARRCASSCSTKRSRSCHGSTR